MLQSTHYQSSNEYWISTTTFKTERRNLSDLTEVFKLFNGYTEIDIKVFYTCW